jgi:hypothetical protein
MSTAPPHDAGLSPFSKITLNGLRVCQAETAGNDKQNSIYYQVEHLIAGTERPMLTHVLILSKIQSQWHIGAKRMLIMSADHECSSCHGHISALQLVCDLLVLFQLCAREQAACLHM